MSTLTSVDRGLARELAAAATSGSSGLLTATRGRLKRLFCLEQGRLVFAASNVIEEQLAERLVVNNMVKSGDVQAAEVEARRQDVKLSALLVEHDVVPLAALRQFQESFVRELLFSTLDWNDGEARFARGNPNVNGEVTIELDCVRLLLEYAARRPSSLDLVRARIGRPDGRPVTRETQTALLDGLELDDVTRHLLAACDGTLSLPELIGRSPAPGEATWRALYGLTLLGVVEVESPEAARQRRRSGPVSRQELLARVGSADDGDYYTVLELNSAATQDEIRDAYYFLARRYHPDRFRSSEMKDLVGEVETYFAKVTEAYNNLHDQELREVYDRARESDRGKQAEPEQDTRFLAKQNHKRARELIERGRFTDAAASLENAIQLDGSNALYPLELGQLLARNPRWRKKAELALLDAVRLDPALVDGYLALGKLYIKTDRPKEAAERFREVMRWEPGHIEAAALLKQLEDKGGILGGLFGS